MTATIDEWDRQCRAAYRNRPFLRDVSDAELDTWFLDIINNLVELTVDGKIGYRTTDGFSQYFVRRCVYGVEEFEHRGRMLPSPKTTGCRLPRVWMPKRAGGWRDVIRSLPKGSIVKYTKNDYAHELVNDGKLFLNNAASYASDEHLPRQDEETARDLSFFAEGWSIRPSAPTTAQENFSIPLRERLGIKHTAPSDYLVWCASRVLEPRLFGEFGDTAVVIHKPAEFARRLFGAFGEQVFPTRSADEWHTMYGRVSYLDRMEPPLRQVIVPFVKDVAFAYQREFRFTLLPTPYCAKLDPSRIALGSLHDIAEVIETGGLEEIKGAIRP